MKDLMKENCGDLVELEELGKHKSNSFTTEQLLDESLKNVNGESRKEVNERMFRALNEILKDCHGKKVAIVSHGAAIKFLLMNWCNLNDDYKLIFDEKNIIELKSPGVIKLEFSENKFKSVTNIL